MMAADGSRGAGCAASGAAKNEEHSYEYDQEDEEVVREYIGGLDSAGRFHGRATVQYESGDTFRGRFGHGARDGRGTMEFDDGSTQSGRYSDGELDGTAVYSFPSGESIVAQYVRGLMQGPFEERDADGSVTCSGTMQDGARTGWIEFFYADGGSLRGTVDDHGAVTGESFTYLYPDGSGLCGRWKDGEMAEAVFRTAEEIATLPTHDVAQKSSKKRRTDVSRPLLRYDPGTAERISSDPLLRDHYEAQRVEAKRSQIPGANEGLFARVPLEASEVACFYAGVRIGHDVVNVRDWAENDNTLSIDDDTVIDVPPQCAHSLPRGISLVSASYPTDHARDDNR